MAEPDRTPTDRRAPMPRWVKVFLVVVVVVTALVIVMVLAGHGPGRHMAEHSTGLASTTRR